MSLINFVKRNSSTILSIIACAGVVGTTVLAVKATPKALDVMKKENATTPKEVVKATWKCYIPAVGVGSATIFCILGANVLNKKQQALIISGYEALSRTYREYRDTVIKLHPEVDEEVREALVRKRADHHIIGLDTPDTKVTFYDPELDISFDMYERELMDAEYHLNRNYSLGMHASLYQFYELLGLTDILTEEQIEYAQMRGWTVSDGIYWIDICHELQDGDSSGTDVYAINYMFPPEPGYLNDWM